MAEEKTGDILAHQLAGDLRVLVSRLRRQMRTARPGDLSAPQIFALRTLHNEGSLTVTELAKAHSMRPQSMGATITALEKEGLVHREPDPNDGCQSILSLTETSRSVIDKSRSARDDFLYKGIKERLAPKEQKELARADHSEETSRRLGI